MLVIRLTIVFLAAMVLYLTSAYARSCPGEEAGLVSIRGTITDQDQAAVPGAQITALPKLGSKTVTCLTDAAGVFSFDLAPAEYILKISASGFTDGTQPVDARSGNVDGLAIVLNVGNIDAYVSVSDNSEFPADVTRTATKTFTALRDIPQSISIVAKQQIADQSMTSIGDVVRYLPGITAHQGENNRDQIIIRGQNSSADFFLNGVRDDVQYYRDLYNVDRIEALRGPNAMIFGRGGGGGVINRVTKDAGLSAFRQFTLQGGSFGDKRASVDIDQPFGTRAAVRVNSVFEDSNSFRNNVGLQRFGINPTLTYNPDSKTNLTFSYEFFRDRRVADRGITAFDNKPADVPIETYYGNPNDSHVRANVNIFSATLDRQFGELSLHNRTTYGDYDRGYQNYVPGVVTADKALVTLTAYNNATTRRNFFSQTDLNYALLTGRIKHNLLGGFELGNQRTNNFRNTGFFNNSAISIQVPYNAPETNVPVTFRQLPSDADNRVKTDLAAAYVQDQIEISRYFQIVAGARFDYFDLKFHSNRNNADLRRIDTLVSPRVGVVFKPVTQLSLYGSYSISYLPSAGDQFSSLAVSTQVLEPEKFENFEVGAKWDVRRDLTFSSALYRLDRTNTKANDPNHAGMFILTGSQRTNGLEFGFSGAITRNWIMTLGYAFQDAFITDATTTALAGQQVAQVPHHNFSIWNKCQLSSRLSTGFGLVTRSDMFAAIDNKVMLPGYIRADAAVYYVFNENWRLQANVENLFNTTYYLNADNNTNISPGSPIGARVSLIARF
jgi:catecholate siderophore receptor